MERSGRKGVAAAGQTPRAGACFVMPRIYRNPSLDSTRCAGQKQGNRAGFQLFLASGVRCKAVMFQSRPAARRDPDGCNRGFRLAGKLLSGAVGAHAAAAKIGRQLPAYSPAARGRNRSFTLESAWLRGRPFFRNGFRSLFSERFQSSFNMNQILA